MVDMFFRCAIMYSFLFLLLSKLTLLSLLFRQLVVAAVLYK